MTAHRLRKHCICWPILHIHKKDPVQYVWWRQQKTYHLSFIKYAGDFEMQSLKLDSSKNGCISDCCCCLVNSLAHYDYSL